MATEQRTGLTKKEIGQLWKQYKHLSPDSVVTHEFPDGTRAEILIQWLEYAHLYYFKEQHGKRRKSDD